MKVKIHKLRKRGFTLIELLVVITIIGILSTVVISNSHTARLKGYDSRRKQDLKSILTAYALYNTNGGAQLTNYGCGGTCQTTDADPNFLAALIASGVLSSIPKAPNNRATNPYMYFDYGPGNPYGFMIVTQLEAAPPSFGYPGSCRPWTDTTSWCSSAVSSNYYCLCHSY